jgi:hypothetical protein
MLARPLLDFLTNPGRFVQQADGARWTVLLQLARQHGLTARCYYMLQSQGLMSQVPDQIRLHGLSAARYSKKQQHSLFYELQQLEAVFGRADFPCVLLKGAAYRALALPMSYGRLFADIDILVPKAQLRSARDKLFFAGFAELPLSEYDRAYYLTWSHQNPPLQHYQRGTVIDLHHHIYPPASAKQIDIQVLLDHATPLPGSAFLVPTLAHLFLHAAVHLFYQEETHRLLKDIVDLQDLLNEVQQQQQLEFIWQQAQQMQVQSALIDACQVLLTLFDNQAARQLLTQHSVVQGQRLGARLVLAMLTGSGINAWVARQLWFLRGHSLKMRWQILLYHAVAKPANGLRQLWRSKLKPR